jgi:fructose-bisphosphate aldolase, class II
MKEKIRLKPGIVYGEELRKLLKHAQKNNYAIPAVNVTTSSTINACLEAAAKINSPIIVQFSHGGSQFFAGKGLSNEYENSSISGAIAGATYLHMMSEFYQVPVIIHTDHCAKKILPWIDGLIEAGENFYQKTGKPLFSSHMIDLSAENLDENIEICATYLTRIAKIEMMLEIELGITGGVEDGVNNESVDNSSLYTQPEDVNKAFEILSKISSNFTIAASFGNVHGVYKPGNVKLEPIILKNSQEYIKHLHQINDEEPVFFVFHGGSGSEKSKIKEAISYGVIKMNLDTDFQWAYWKGTLDYYNENKDFLQTQLGNPKGEDQPNKSYYDPRAWLRSGEKSFVTRLIEAFEDLNSTDVLE